MATGWAKEGAVQDQIDDTVKDGVRRAKSRIPNEPPRIQGNQVGRVGAFVPKCVRSGPRQVPVCDSS